MSELVTLRTIASVEPIADADRIELARIDGWQCVVNKGSFRPGDLAVFFHLDCFLPAEDPRFAFLLKEKRTWNGREGVRIRTVKLRGQLSQGLALPVSQFPEVNYTQRLAGTPERPELPDLAKLIGVEKWEPPIPAELGGQVEGYRPSWIPKTDQERIQNLDWPAVLETYSSNIFAGKPLRPFEVTVKLDGSSMTVYYDGEKSGVCSRNLELKESESNSLWRVARSTKLIEALEAHGMRLAIQGELIGPGIQGNHEGLKEHEFRVFDVYDGQAGRYLGQYERQVVLEGLRLKGATILEVPTAYDGIGLIDQTIEQMLAMAEGPSLHAPTREGIVFKFLDGSFSFKVVANSYLLAHAER